MLGTLIGDANHLIRTGQYAGWAVGNTTSIGIGQGGTPMRSVVDLPSFPVRTQIGMGACEFLGQQISCHYVYHRKGGEA